MQAKLKTLTEGTLPFSFKKRLKTATTTSCADLIKWEKIENAKITFEQKGLFTKAAGCFRLELSYEMGVVWQLWSLKRTESRYLNRFLKRSV